MTTDLMTSVYAIRLYELIIAWRSCHKTPIFELEEFRKKLGVEPNEYTRMSNFKPRVLDVAVDQKPKREKMTLNDIVIRHPNETIGKSEPDIYKMFGSKYHII